MNRRFPLTLLAVALILTPAAAPAQAAVNAEDFRPALGILVNKHDLVLACQPRDPRPSLMLVLANLDGAMIRPWQSMPPVLLNAATVAVVPCQGSTPILCGAPRLLHAEVHFQAVQFGFDREVFCRTSETLRVHPSMWAGTLLGAGIPGMPGSGEAGDLTGEGGGRYHGPQ